MKNNPPGFRDKDFLEIVVYLENGGQIFPASILSELYSDFPEKYDEAFSVQKSTMILSDKELGILSSLITDARKRVRVELIENKKLLFSRSPFESI
mmetsp:Transcript_5269/g.4859  ORF Transcript_5269/g.4859 Transcript_5269/m.4859 type:complete len:96 (+) Transcript_5269:17-304(+)